MYSTTNENLARVVDDAPAGNTTEDKFPGKSIGQLDRLLLTQWPGGGGRQELTPDQELKDLISGNREYQMTRHVSDRRDRVITRGGHGQDQRRWHPGCRW